MNSSATSSLKSRALTTDGHRPYLEAVESAFGDQIDYAQLVKLYGESPNKGPERKYSPNVCLGMRERLPAIPSRRTSATNLGHAVALHFMYYNFARIH